MRILNVLFIIVTIIGNDYIFPLLAGPSAKRNMAAALVYTLVLHFGLDSGRPIVGYCMGNRMDCTRMVVDFPTLVEVATTKEEGSATKDLRPLPFHWLLLQLLLFGLAQYLHLDLQHCGW